VERKRALETASLALRPVKERLEALLEEAKPTRIDDGSRMTLRHTGLKCTILLQSRPAIHLVLEAQPYGLIRCWRTEEENLAQYIRPGSLQADLVMAWATGVLGLGHYIKSTLQHPEGFGAKQPAENALT